MFVEFKKAIGSRWLVMAGLGSLLLGAPACAPEAAPVPEELEELKQSLAAPIGQTISLKACLNGRFISADGNLGASAPLVADRTAAAGWELFQVVDAGGGTIALRVSETGKYVSADTNLGGQLVANRTAIGDWERFQWVDFNNGTIGLIARSTGRYVSTDLNRGANAPLYADRTSAGCWEAFSVGTSGSGGGGSGLGAILSESTFNAMFPSRNPFYTYNALLAAAATFPSFATTGDTDTRKREVAAFLANVSHETGALVYIEEINKSVMCDTSWGPPGCGCAPGKWYYGRGPLQLSWNGNYCAAGNALGLNLMNDPDLLARDANAAWRSGFWFWMTQTGAGSMTGHNAIVNGAGFGETIRTINGALECYGRNPAAVQSRVDAYLRFTNLLGVSPGTNTGC
jgi:predicted chitinase